MKKIRFCSIALSILLPVIACAQTNKVKGRISAGNSAELTIYRIYPDSFPNVSVVFKAQTKGGNAVWGLKKDNIKVEEDSQKCQIVSVEQISANEPINIGIVIDHSGSMNEDSQQLDTIAPSNKLTYDTRGNPVFPKGYISPLNNAKMAVKEFIKSFNVKKDFISVVGFSSRVDKKCKLTHDTAKVNDLINSMKADSSTALYDAMLVAIKQIRKAKGLKALVVLTDGQDNSSKQRYIKVINKAKDENVPIYIIGLGDADRDTLAIIANQTNGEFYYTGSAASLNVVYGKIRKNLQAFYEVVYRSENFSTDDTNRKVEVSFDIKNISVHTKPAYSNFPLALIASANSPTQPEKGDTQDTAAVIPAKVSEYVANKETNKQYYIFGGIALLTVISAGTLLYKYSRKASQKTKQDDNNATNPAIVKLFPNPTSGPVNIEYTGGAGQLLIVNLNGQPVKVLEVTGSTAFADLSNVPNGEYLATIIANGSRSNTVKFIVNK